MAKCIMVQGTMSGAGKSLITAALCRIFMQDGYRVAPFKSQNMALNSYITRDGLEMGRAQVVQAQAAGREPDVRMNPILLKPSSDVGSQVIINGRVHGDYRARDYFRMKKTLIPDIMEAYESLAAENDIIVIEGAGSPAEINLKADDIVNMGLAKLVDAPVLLVGDIDRGGVFAQLYGTIALLEEEERKRIIGTVINKFRGDVEILKPGLSMLEEKTKVPVIGVIPYTKAQIDEEDSLAPLLQQKEIHKAVDIAVIRLPHISNFTDFTPLEEHPALGVRYVSRTEELGEPDMIILPGTKNTMGDLEWLRQCGLEMKIRRLADRRIPVLGVCGGYQMMGTLLEDPEAVEHGGSMRGLGLLPVKTVFQKEKVRSRVTGTVLSDLFFTGGKEAAIDGYEIHMGSTVCEDPAAGPFCLLSDKRPEGTVKGLYSGTYLHGLFDSGELVTLLAEYFLSKKGLKAEGYHAESHFDFQERQFDLLAEEVRKGLDMKLLYRAMGIGGPISQVHTKPADIEETSMKIISAELEAMGWILPREHEAVVKRVIHTTADFDYAKNLVFTEHALEKAALLLASGAVLISDTNMTKAGISKPAMDKLGCRAECFMAEPEIAEIAKKEGTTRAAACMQKAAREYPGCLAAVGNAPTALYELCRQIENGFRPGFVIAVPVGFVNVTEAKEAIFACCRKYQIPAIAAMGRKGGSTVAAAICNALLYTAADMLEPKNRGWN